MVLLFGSVGMGWEQWLVDAIFFWVRFYVGLVVGAADGLDVGDPKKWSVRVVYLQNRWENCPKYYHGDKTYLVQDSLSLK